uniref:Multiple epidermal growth factor-like domains protein 10 n=1 Tax=Crassostrea virginica TaxID=6565 RepID=A0A8B8DHD0_CRAVI|nr:multiple epidermal growth factor-like domains protein 10 [Crassostrea virginica]
MIMANSTDKASDCGFNSYHNGSTCVPCEIGFYGKNCSDRCAPGLYGYACSKLCRNCSQANCHYIFGCRSDDKSSTILYSSSVENSDTSSLTLNLKDSRSSTAIITDGEVISTTPTSSSGPNILVLIAAIGGLIALFLLVLVIQTCLKLYMRRKERARATQMSSKVKSEQPEDMYEAIDESLLTAGVVQTNEHKQRKYYQLHKNSNSEFTVPYQQIRNEPKYQEIDENCVSSNSSDSNNSNRSYLEPKTNVNVPSSYIEVLDSGSSAETSHSKGRLTGSVNPNTNDSSAQYIDPVHNINLPTSLNNCSPENNDAYLDVTNETIL